MLLISISIQGSGQQNIGVEAEKYLEKGQYEKAIEELQNSFKKSTDSALLKRVVTLKKCVEMIEIANEHLKYGNFPNFVNNLESVLKLNPTDNATKLVLHDYWLNKGDLKYLQGRYTEAAVRYKESLKYDTNDSVKISRIIDKLANYKKERIRADSLLKLGDYPAAKVLYKSLFKYVKGDATAKYMLKTIPKVIDLKQSIDFEQDTTRNYSKELLKILSVNPLDSVSKRLLSANFLLLANKEIIKREYTKGVVYLQKAAFYDSTSLEIRNKLAKAEQQLLSLNKPIPKSPIIEPFPRYLLPKKPLFSIISTAAVGLAAGYIVLDYNSGWKKRLALTNSFSSGNTFDIFFEGQSAYADLKEYKKNEKYRNIGLGVLAGAIALESYIVRNYVKKMRAIKLQPSDDGLGVNIKYHF